METRSLPIMLFDERKLTPSFGYVFDPKWLDPFESIVSILWKLARMNRLSGQTIVTQLASTSVEPYEGAAAQRSEIDRGLKSHLGAASAQLRPERRPRAINLRDALPPRSRDG
jgi:hypothetical protein